jgi:WD40 repeat protein
MTEIQTAWEERNVPRVLELLEQTRPGPGEDDLRGFEWYYWQRRCNAELHSIHVPSSLHGSSGQVARALGGSFGMRFDTGGLVLSPDGSRAAAAGPMGAPDARVQPTIRLWDTVSGKVAVTLSARYIVPPLFSADGRRVLVRGSTAPTPGGGSSGAPQPYRVFDTRTGKEVATLAGALRGQTVAFSPDGTRVAAVTGSAKGAHTLTVWSADDGRVLFTAQLGDAEQTVLGRPEKEFLSRPREAQLVFRPDGKELALLTSRKQVRDRDDSPPPPPPPGPDNLIRFLDGATGKERLRITPPGLPRGLAYSPDGKRLVGMGVRSDVLIKDVAKIKAMPVWDAATGREVLTLPLSGAVDGVVFSPDGKLVAGCAAVWTRGQVVPLWDAETGQPRPGIVGDRAVLDVAFSGPDRLTAAFTDGSVRTYDIAEPAPLMTGKAPMVFIPPRGGRTLTKGTQTDRTERNVNLLAAHPGGPRLAVLDALDTGADGPKARTVRVVVPGSRDVRADLRITAGQVLYAVHFSPDGRTFGVLRGPMPPGSLASGSPKKGGENPPMTLTVVSAATGKSLWSATLPLTARRYVWGAGGARVAVAEVDVPGKQLRARVIDAATGREVLATDPVPFPANQPVGGSLIAVAFSADGRRVAVTAQPGTNNRQTVAVWDATNGRLLRPARPLNPEGTFPSNGAFVFSPDGRLLLLGERTGAIRVGETHRLVVWDVETGERRCVVDALGDISSAGFSPNGRRLLVVEQGRVKRGAFGSATPALISVHDAETGRPLLVIPDGTNPMLVQFTPDGQRLWGLRQEGAMLYAQVWDASPLSPEVEGSRAFRAAARQAVTRAEVIEAVKADPRLGEPARRHALALADLVEDNASTINEASWAVAKEPGHTREEYLTALRRAEYALSLAKESANYLNTLGAAQYRLGRYAEARDTLRRADEGHKGNRPADHALLAMVYHHLGDRAEALRYLQLARARVKAPIGGWDRGKNDPGQLLAEAEALIKPPPR